MKKIMFNDRYGLTKAVLNGTKTMTRRIIKGNHENVTAYHANGGWHYIADTQDGDSVELKPRYEVGEIVAVAQSYGNVYQSINDCMKHEFGLRVAFFCHNNVLLTNIPGWNNKMFVRANLMPFRVRIKDVKLERLQDINDVDAIKEGIYDANDFMNPGAYTYFGCTNIYKTPCAAFADLIDRISGKGTWERNPWVFVYEFELLDL